MWWFVSDGLACGGFFCNGYEPVEQTGETIVFDVQDGTVTTHAAIQYEGRAEDFAWVLPAPGIPEVFISTETLFDTLQVRTEPRLSLTLESDCANDKSSDATFDTGSAVLPPDVSSSDYGVKVLATPEVGPYTGVVLAATDAVALTNWLQDNGFAIPDVFAASAAPYLQEGVNFLALRLNKTAEVGALPPLGVKWEGTRPSVPLTLTAVAAQPNLPLTVYVLGDYRAVPTNYLHVQMNPLVYDWFGRGINWLERVGRAADEAGGRGFATTYAGPTGAADLGCDQYSTNGLATITVALDWFLAVQGGGFTGTSELMNVLREVVPAPPGVDERDFYNFWSAYEAEWAALDATFDPVAATALLEERIVTPCFDAERILAGNPYLTRLTSTISPDEMTVDPQFGFNPDLPEVSNELRATFHDYCNGTGVLTLPGGFELGVGEMDGYLPSSQWVDERLTYNALVIEQLSESGSGTVIADYRNTLLGDEVRIPCGCASGGLGGVGVGAMAVALAFRRRRSG